MHATTNDPILRAAYPSGLRSRMGPACLVSDAGATDTWPRQSWRRFGREVLQAVEAAIGSQQQPITGDRG